MARKAKAERKTGLYYARAVRGMSRTELVKRSGVSKQQSRASKTASSSCGPIT
jgi:hypothetical protein